MNRKSILGGASFILLGPHRLSSLGGASFILLGRRIVHPPWATHRLSTLGDASYIHLGRRKRLSSLGDTSYIHLGRRKRPHPSSTPLPPLRGQGFRADASAMGMINRPLHYYSTFFSSLAKIPLTYRSFCMVVLSPTIAVRINHEYCCWLEEIAMIVTIF